ncbi:MAG: phosphatase PAP2 family protein [Rhodospirillum sp.]|nr:phosphatase PAP2 family protein [Rhodospirillum sp.]MCF8489545.1 phosphatase PAP2 family protein [Rhodospirillum sp.]MCF8499734.1 phosphatase PAP2 family protein [Rhodospirillum sp.]
MSLACSLHVCSKLRAHGAWLRTHPRLGIFLYLSVLCVLLMIFVDKPLEIYLKANVHGHMEGFFKVITGIGSGLHWYVGTLSAAVLCLIAAHMALTTEAHARFLSWARSWGFVLAAVASSGLVVTIMKHVFGRLRPRHLFDQGLYGFEPFSLASGANSFPSGHSQTICAAMVALMALFPRHGIWFAGLAFLVTLSRLMTTVHFLSDTLMGAYIGIVAVLLLKPLFEAGGHSLRIGRSR